MLVRVRIPTGNQLIPESGFRVIAVVKVHFYLAMPVATEVSQNIQATRLIFIPGVEKGVAG